MTDEELISVVVPIYNVESYLHQCIDSILSQTYTHLEIILVDNGSTDRSPEICDEYAQKDKRVKVIHQKNAGLVNARKVGLKAASADIIGCVDGDDWIEPDMYETLYGIMSFSQADVVVGGHTKSFPNYSERFINTIPPGIYDKEKLVNCIYPRMICCDDFSRFGIFTYHWNKLFRKSVIYDAQMQVDEKISIGEDAACVYPALLNAEKICVIDTCDYHYRQRTNSMMRSAGHQEQEFSGIQCLYRYLRKVFSSSPYADILLPQLDRYILNLAIIRLDLTDESDKENKFIFPFRKAKKGDRVVLLGAGTFGQHIYRRFLADNTADTVIWVDDNFKKYQESNLPVFFPMKIFTEKFDYVLIAKLNETVAEKMRERLNNFGIPDEKIAWIDYYLQHSNLILDKFEPGDA